MPSPTFSDGSRVLLVEDNQETCESLQLLLTLRGYDVRTAADGLDGFRQALEWRPNAIVSDIGLPGIDGWRLASCLRETFQETVRLIALTSHGRVEDRQRSREAGFDAHLTKPADPAELLELLSAVLPNRNIDPGSAGPDTTVQGKSGRASRERRANQIDE